MASVAEGEAREALVAGILQLTVRSVCGGLLWGPQAVNEHTSVATLRRIIAASAQVPAVAIRILLDDKVLEVNSSLKAAGVQTHMELSAVILSGHVEAHKILRRLCDATETECSSTAVMDDPDSVTDSEVSASLAAITAACAGGQKTLSADVETWLEVLLTSGNLIFDDGSSGSMGCELSCRQLSGERICHKPGLLYLMADSVDLRMPGPCYDEMVTCWGFVVVDLTGELGDIVKTGCKQRASAGKGTQTSSSGLSVGPGSVWYARVDEYPASPWLAFVEIPPSLHGWRRMGAADFLRCIASNLSEFFNTWACEGRAPLLTPECDEA